ncbi:MAG: hypothetical protein WC856_29040 [Methylococcaceae bacterium]|jgi:hypothetical protein
MRQLVGDKLTDIGWLQDWEYDLRSAEARLQQATHDTPIITARLIGQTSDVAQVFSKAVDFRVEGGDWGCRLRDNAAVMQNMQ